MNLNYIEKNKPIGKDTADMAYRKRKSSIDLSEYELQSQKIPKSYDGFTIIHISDLYDEVFGAQQQLLAEIIIEQSPDINYR